MTCLTLLCIESIRVWTISSGIFLPLLTNHSLQVRKSFWWRASFTNCLLQDHPQILYGLRSGLCAGHSRDSRQWLFFQDVTTLARWTGALSSCKIVALPLRCLSATSGKKRFSNMQPHIISDGLLTLSLEVYHYVLQFVKRLCEVDIFSRLSQQCLLVAWSPLQSLKLLLLLLPFPQWTLSWIPRLL